MTRDAASFIVVVRLIGVQLKRFEKDVPVYKASRNGLAFVVSSFGRKLC